MKRKVSVGSDRALLPVLPKERKQRSDHNSGGGDEEGIEDVLVDKELMFLIFGPDLFTWKDLPVLASVCRRWWRLTQDAVLRQQLVAGNVVSFGLADPSGHGDHVDKLRPKCVEALARERVRDVSAGLYHSLVATKDGGLLSFGYGSDGRLGHGDQRTQMIPRPVLSLSGVRIVKVAAGAHHSLVLSDQGNVFSFGVGIDGSLGHGDQARQLVPKLISSLQREKVVDIAAGSAHSLVVAESGNVYSFGLGSEGALGHGDTDMSLVPKKIEHFVQRPAAKVAAGGSHSLVLSKEGRVLSFGQNSYGQLGLGHFSCMIASPAQVQVEAAAVEIEAGAHHSLVLTNDGRVYSFGLAQHGQLGHGNDLRDNPEPTLIRSLERERIVDVAAGNNFSLVLSAEGTVFSFGCGKNGRLGKGDESNATQPTVVFAAGHTVSAISAGYSHSLVVV
jgi:alpha-tubulin suppressor-like RCC1 family protein